MPPSVAHGDFAQTDIAGLAARPHQQRDGLHHVDFSFGSADVRYFFKSSAERQNSCTRVIHPRQRASRRQCEIARPAIPTQNRAKRSAVIEKQRARRAIGNEARPQPFGKHARPRQPSLAIGARPRRRAEPQHPVEISARPIAIRRPDPAPGLRVSKMRKALARRLRRILDPPPKTPYRIIPGHKVSTRLNAIPTSVPKMSVRILSPQPRNLKVNRSRTAGCNNYEERFRTPGAAGVANVLNSEMANSLPDALYFFAFGKVTRARLLNFWNFLSSRSCIR